MTCRSMRRRPRGPRDRARGIFVNRGGVAPAPPSFPPGILDGIAATKYVSPTGGSGAGTIGDPWSLAWALTHVSTAGEVVFLRGGDYITSGASWTFARAGVVGGGLDDPTGKIIWMPYPGEIPRFINTNVAKSIAVFKMAAAYNWYVDLITLRQHEDRWHYSSPGDGYWIQAASTTGVKLIHTTSREGSNGTYVDSAVGDLEIWNHTAMHDGNADPATARSHGFYWHHLRNAGKLFKARDYITFDHQGLCGQVFASSAPEAMDDFDIDGIWAWNGGGIASSTAQQNLSIGGTDGSNVPLQGFKARNIWSWNLDSIGRSCFRFYNAGGLSQDADVADFWLIGGNEVGYGRYTIQLMNWASFSSQRMEIVNLAVNPVRILWTDETATPYSSNGYTTWDNHHFWGADPANTQWRGGATNRTWAGWKTFTGIGGTDTATTALPTTTWVFVRDLSKYFRGRGLVGFFNWEQTARVAANLSTFLVPGQTFAVKNVQASEGWLDGADVSVYAGPAGGSPITVLPANGIVYFPSDGVTPLQPVGTNISPAPGEIANGGPLGSLPTLPDATNYPVGSWVYLSTDGFSYQNQSNVWVHTTSWTNPPVNTSALAPYFSLFRVRGS